MPEVRALLAQLDNGEICPDPVTLRQLPAGATLPMRQIAEAFARVVGVRRYAGMPDAVPFSLSYATELTGVPYQTARRSLARLVDAGVLEWAGTMPSVEGRRGTHLYMPRRLPAVTSDGQSPVDAGQVREGELELVHDPQVPLAQVAAGDAAAGAPVGDAGGQVGGAHVGHVPEPKCSEGGHLSEDELIQALKDELDAVEIGGRA